MRSQGGTAEGASGCFIEQPSQELTNSKSVAEVSDPNMLHSVEGWVAGTGSEAGGQLGHTVVIAGVEKEDTCSHVRRQKWGLLAYPQHIPWFHDL